MWQPLRVGRRKCLWQEALDLPGVGRSGHKARRVYRLTERTIDKRDDPLLLPEYILEGWTTTLPERFDMQAIIALYADHATHEQFHSEFKTDMDLERLASGKFDTNFLECQLTCVALNLLRLIGQTSTRTFGFNPQFREVLAALGQQRFHAVALLLQLDVLLLLARD